MGGLLLGGLSAYGAYQISSNRSNYMLLLACSSTTAAVMGYRAFNSRKLMPAGIATGLSLAMIGYLYFAVIRNMKIITDYVNTHSWHCVYSYQRELIYIFPG